jgi:hypothetical protein
VGKDCPNVTSLRNSRDLLLIYPQKDSKRDQDMTLRSLVFTVFADPQDIKAYSKALLPAKLVTIRPNSKIPAI